MSQSRLALAVSPTLSGSLLSRASSPSHSHHPDESNSRSSASPSNTLKRKRSEAPLSIHLNPSMAESSSSALEVASPPGPSLTDLPLDETSETDQDTSDIPVPPSPVPTEIIEEPSLDVDQALIVEAIKAERVKVRDFAYEPMPHGLPTPEVWRAPLHTLVLHDRSIRAGPSSSTSFKLPGKLLWRLLDSGLVTEEEANRNWSEKDLSEMNAYKSRPNGPYPYTMRAMKKPTAAFRAQMRLDVYSPQPDDTPEDQIYVPPDEPGMDDGMHAPRPVFLERGPDTEEDSPSPKKRKIGGSDYTTSRSPSPRHSRPLSRTSKHRASASPRTASAVTPPVSPQTSKSRLSGGSPTPSPSPSPGQRPERTASSLIRTRTMVW